jgi:hypothetical protein
MQVRWLLWGLYCAVWAVCSQPCVLDVLASMQCFVSCIHRELSASQHSSASNRFSLRYIDTEQRHHKTEHSNVRHPVWAASLLACCCHIARTERLASPCSAASRCTLQYLTAFSCFVA